MEMSLCFLCDEPFTMEHQSEHKNIEMFMMDVDDEGEPLGQFMKSFDELKPLVKNGFSSQPHTHKRVTLQCTMGKYCNQNNTRKLKKLLVNCSILQFYTQRII